MHPQYLSNTYLVGEPAAAAFFVDAGGPVEPLDRRRPSATASTPTARAADPPPPRPRRASSASSRARWPDLQVLVAPRRARSTASTGDDGARRDVDGRRPGGRARCTRRATRRACSSLLVEGNVFTGDTLFKNSVGGVRAPGHTTYADLKHSIMDVLLALPPETVIRPGHTDPTTVADEWETQRVRPRLARPGPRGRRAVHRDGRAGDARAARRRLRRRAQGVGALARRRATTSSPGSQVKRGSDPRPRADGRARTRSRPRVCARSATRRAARGRRRRSRQVGHARGQPRRAPTRTPQRALAERQLETAEQIVAALGTMKGAAMKLGQVMSFLDVGLVPEEYREEFQAKLAELRDAAPKVSFKDMKKVIEQRVRRAARRRLRDLRPGADRRRLDRPGLQGAPATTAATSRSRSSTRASHSAVRSDMQNLGMILRLMKRVAPGLDPKAMGDEIRSRIEEELDYELEAQNQRTARAHLPRPPVHRHPRRRHRRCRHERVIVSEFVDGPRLRGDEAAARRPSATASARSSSASTSAACTATTSSAATRTPATACCSTTAGWRSWTSGCSSASRPRSAEFELADRSGWASSAAAPSSSSTCTAAAVIGDPELLHRGGDPRAVRRHHLVVHARRGDRAHARDRDRGDDPDERPALAPLRQDAPRDAAARPPLRPAPGDADAGRHRPAARDAPTGTGSRASGSTATSPVTELGAPEAEFYAAPRRGGAARVDRACGALALARLVASRRSSSSRSAARCRPTRCATASTATARPARCVFIARRALLTVALFPGPLLAGASGLLFGTALGHAGRDRRRRRSAPSLAFCLARWWAHDAVEELAGAAAAARCAPGSGAAASSRVLYARHRARRPVQPRQLRRRPDAGRRCGAFAAATAIGVRAARVRLHGARRLARRPRLAGGDRRDRRARRDGVAGRVGRCARCSAAARPSSDAPGPGTGSSSPACRSAARR